jgi:predicted N-acetyltransferase YhbS
MDAVSIRPAAEADAAALAETVRQGFETYRAWAPRGWEPPPASLHVAGIRGRLGAAGTWCVLAEAAGGEPAGHVALRPAGAEERALAHLWMLFVREPWWGSGLAGELLARATAEATARGYAAFRLYTPVAHARARAFYEREGWRAAGAPAYEHGLALELVEYRRALG